MPESYATKKMDFAFKMPEGAKTMEPEGKDEPGDSPSEEMTPEELGASVSAAMKSGSDSALYEAICKIIDSHKGG